MSSRMAPPPARGHIDCATHPPSVTDLAIIDSAPADAIVRLVVTGDPAAFARPHRPLPSAHLVAQSLHGRPTERFQDRGHSLMTKGPGR
jgi:hypothetical protein